MWRKKIGGVFVFVIHHVETLICWGLPEKGGAIWCISGVFVFVTHLAQSLM